MKQRAALKKSVTSLKLLCGVGVPLVLLAVKYPSTQAWAGVGVVVLFVGLNAWNVWRIKQRARQDSRFLDSEVPE